MAFGYSPEKAERTKTRLDQEQAKLEARLRSMAEIVPGAGAIVDRLDQAKDIAREAVSDLQDLVDERTDSEVAT